MKKIIVLLILSAVLISLVSCSSSESRGGIQNNSKTVDDIMNEAGETTAGETAAPAETQNSSPDDGGEYDVDLTKMNSTMVYSEVYNMMIEPDTYVGKEIKMSGTFAVYQGETQNYFACLIKDATACCSQGIEFVLKDARSYPTEYPDLGDEITVTGRFETYEEENMKYIHLVDAELI